MKTRILLSGIILMMIYFSCDDSTTEVGMGMLPDEDKINVYDTTMYLTSSTVKIDSIYAKSISGYLGEIYDPDYGTIKSSYACEFYPSYNFLLDSMIYDKIDSVRLFLFFNSYLGDSLAPMEVSVYPLIKPLEKSYYTNVDPSEFCDMNKPVAKYGYTIRNPYVSDSLVSLGYYKAISIPLPDEFGQKFLEETKKAAPNAFSSVEAFTKFFPGTYLTTTFGVGSMLATEYTRIHIYYTRKYTATDSEGNDSTVIAPDYADYRVTKEVVQLNSFQNKNDSFLLSQNDDSTFIKSPVGVYTKITIPIKEISKKIGKRKFSSIELSLKAYPRNDWEYGFKYPGTGTISASAKAKMLLIEADSMKTFFESQSIANNKTSYFTTLDASSLTYKFNNIANIVQNAIDNAPEKDLDLLLIPVQTAYTQESYYNQYVDVDYTTTHYLYPSAVTLKKGGENLKIRIVASDLAIEK